jgi:hypothetical protein
MRRLFACLRKNIRLIDRVMLCFFLAWAMLLATAVVAGKYARRAGISRSVTEQISQIYEWCQGALAPAQEEQP